MADTRSYPDLADFTRGVHDGERCRPVKDSIDLVECINSVCDKGKIAAKNPDSYDAGVFLTQWRLQDTMLLALQELPSTPRVNNAIKVSRDMTVASFVAAQRTFRKIGLSDAAGLSEAGLDNDVSFHRWSYWTTQPVPSWVTPEK